VRQAGYARPPAPCQARCKVTFLGVLGRAQRLNPCLAKKQAKVNWARAGGAERASPGLPGRAAALVRPAAHSRLAAAGAAIQSIPDGRSHCDSPHKGNCTGALPWSGPRRRQPGLLPRRAAGRGRPGGASQGGGAAATPAPLPPAGRPPPGAAGSIRHPAVLAARIPAADRDLVRRQLEPVVVAVPLPRRRRRVEQLQKAVPVRGLPVGAELGLAVPAEAAQLRLGGVAPVWREEGGGRAGARGRLGLIG
jgi:hypothetical protein